VCIAGSFNDWHPNATPMVALGNGRWVKELMLPPGRYEYRLVADGEWVDDPKAKEVAPNPHGGVNAVLTIG
jgi:1,4-alpha-glucan branching enzyme